jgi:ATP-dependent helicase/nuclease subunit A
MAAHSEGAQLTMFDAPVARDGRVSRLIGTLAHRVLEYWDFAADPEPLVTRVLAAGDVEESHWSEAHEELTCMLRSFRESPACAELRRASIVGREVPFAVPFDDGMQPSAASGMRGRCILEGVLDIVYRLDGRLWIADYKTDRLESGEAEAKAAMYGLQARLYRQAVRSSVGEEPGFAFIFLRTGQHIIMET